MRPLSFETLKVNIPYFVVPTYTFKFSRKNKTSLNIDNSYIRPLPIIVKINKIPGFYTMFMRTFFYYLDLIELLRQKNSYNTLKRFYKIFQDSAWITS